MTETKTRELIQFQFNYEKIKYHQMT